MHRKQLIQIIRGPATSSILRESLVPYVTKTLSQLFHSPGQAQVANEDEREAAIFCAITSSFKQLDDEIISDGIDALKTAKTHTEALSRIAPGFAGSCALLSIYDPNSNLQVLHRR